MPKLAPKDCPLLFLDFETGGLSAAQHDITEVGCVLTDPSGQTVIEEYVAKVLPVRPVDAQAAAINGYTAEKWAAAGAVPLKHALIKVLTMGRDAMLTCHNTPFDKSFLEAALALHQMRWNGSYHSIDTVSLAMPLLRGGHVPNVRLVTLTAYLKITHDNAHSALADVRACREVYLRLMEAYEPGITKLAASVS